MDQSSWLARQATRYNCGPANLAYCMSVLGYSPRELSLRKIARTSRINRTSIGKLAHAARKTSRLEVKDNVSPEGERAWEWLVAGLDSKDAVVLVVDDGEHCVPAVDLTSDHRVVLIEPDSDDGEYAAALGRTRSAKMPPYAPCNLLPNRCLVTQHDRATVMTASLPTVTPTRGKQ